MGTQIETETLSEVLALIDQANTLLERLGTQRIYIVAKFDTRECLSGRPFRKIESVQTKFRVPDADRL